LLANVLAAIAIIATTVLTARVFGPTGRGELTIATLLATLMVTLGSLGLGSAATYQMARAERAKSVVLGNSVLLGLALGLLLVAVGSGVVVFGHKTLHGVPASYLLLSMLVVPFALALANIQSVYLGLQRFREYNRVTVAQAALPLLLIGVALLAFGGGVRAAIIATAVSAALLMLAYLATSSRAIGIRWRPDRGYIKAAFSYGVRVHIGNVLGFLGYRLDVFILDAYKSTAAVGLYSAGVVIAERLWMPSQAVSTALFPRIAEEKDESVRRSITPLIARNTLWLTAVFAALFFVFSNPIVTLLYSSKFGQSAGVLRYLLIGIVAFGPARVLGNDIAARGRPLVNSLIAGLSVALNLGLNLVLIPRYGISGAAWASSVSYSLLFVLTVAFYCRIAKVSVRAVLVPTRKDGEAYLRLFGRLLRRLAPRS
jgi:O-antigen/teichoic acid export membrane protein